MMFRAVIGAALGIPLASLALSVPAFADDPDPHVPNPQAMYCPGGGAGSMIYAGWCDGVPFPDGSYWHYIQYGMPMIGHPAGLLSPGMQCVVPNGAVPAPAPPGGCGGAV